MVLLRLWRHIEELPFLSDLQSLNACEYYISVFQSMYLFLPFGVCVWAACMSSYVRHFGLVPSSTVYPCNCYKVVSPTHRLPVHVSVPYSCSPLKHPGLLLGLFDYVVPLDHQQMYLFFIANEKNLNFNSFQISNSTVIFWHSNMHVFLHLSRVSRHPEFTWPKSRSSLTMSKGIPLNCRTLVKLICHSKWITIRDCFCGRSYRSRSQNCRW